ncbi:MULTISPECIES: PIG-L family deacetylase [unclassified Micromonospora]|uniref:PIG-L family deacetylase n=1 Tax=unclassified Micromonospora TaxID=2617518 RepID=UPI0033AF5D7A
MSFPASAPVLSDGRPAPAVFAHPDDAAFGCTGKIAGWVDEGADVAFLIITRATPADSTTQTGPRCTGCAWRNPGHTRRRSAAHRESS